MRIPLSPFDHGMVGETSYPVEFAFVYAAPLDAKLLEPALRRVLGDFAPLRSVLAPDGDHSLAFTESDAGCPFSVQQVRALPAPTDTAGWRACLDSVSSVPDQPTARLRLLAAPTASALLVSVSHAAADGFSYFLFLTAWSRACRGKDYLAPLLDRTPLLPLPSPRSGRSRDAARVTEILGVSWLPGRKRSVRDIAGWETVLLTAPELAAMLRQAAAPPDDLSINDVLSAYLWKRYAPRFAAADGRCSLSFPCDFRGRLPDFPPNYFGNAVGMVQLRSTHDEVASRRLGELAGRVRRAIDAYDQARASAALQCAAALRRERGLTAMEELHIVDPDHGLLLSNLSRLPLKQLDFGAGPPTAVVPLTPCPRLAFILPAPNDGVSVHVCLPDEKKDQAV